MNVMITLYLLLLYITSLAEEWQWKSYYLCIRMRIAPTFAEFNLK
jgi:hypothetical protein